MEHTTAVETDAVGRYLLGEMDPAERDDFEEHYFLCPECGDDVRLGAVFHAGARRALAAPPEPSRRAPFWRWFSAPVLAPVALAAALSTVLIYQNAITIPALKHGAEAGQIVPAIVLHGASRGTDDVAHVPAGSKAFILTFDLPGASRYPASRYTVEDGSGSTLENIAGGATSDSATLLLQGSRLSPGRYTLTVRGLKGAQDEGVVLATYRFVVE